MLQLIWKQFFGGDIKWPKNGKQTRLGKKGLLNPSLRVANITEFSNWSFPALSISFSRFAADRKSNERKPDLLSQWPSAGFW